MALRTGLASFLAGLFLAHSVHALPIERCMNLSGFLEVPKGADWIYPFKPEHIDTIAEAGFDTLRIPVNAASFWTGEGLEPDFENKLRSTVRRARDAGLFVVVDLHHYSAFIGDPKGKKDEFLAIWTYLARMFEGQSGLAFELLNEPTGEADIDDFLPVFDEARGIIRQYHPDAWVIFGGAQWNNLNHMLALPEPSDPLVAHTFHYYAPNKFTHQQAPWHENPFPPRDWGSVAERDRMSGDMARASEHHTPVFLGEFGVINTAPPEDRLAWLTHLRSEAERAGLPWCHWGFGARFGVFDTSADSWRTEVLKALID